MKNFISIVVVLISTLNLSGQGGRETQFATLDLAKAFSNKQDVFLSQFVDKISYISLETNPQSVIGRTAYYEVTNDYIIVRQRSRDGYKIQLFDRNTGKFIREIGKQGNGPGEYRFPTYIPYNPVKKELYAISPSKEILGYDLSGRNVEIVKMPEILDKNGTKISLGTRPLIFANMLDANIFVGHFVNDWGLERDRLVLLTNAGILKIFPNYQVLRSSKIKGGLQINRDNVLFYKWDNELYFLEPYCDTLYQVTNNSLFPRYYFDWGKYNVTWLMRADVDINGNLFKDYFYITDIDENRNYIFIKIKFEGKDYIGFIEKNTNLMTFCNENNLYDSGLIDDINGLTDVIPLDFTQDNEMVFVIQPFKLTEWFKANPNKAIQAKNKLTWLKDINEFSNPIIAIGKCKE